MPRYAMVVVVEADFPEIAWEGTAERLGKLGGDMPPLAVYIGGPCRIDGAEADEYATSEIHLLADGYRRIAQPQQEDTPDE